MLSMLTIPDLTNYHSLCTAQIGNRLQDLALVSLALLAISLDGFVYDRQLRAEFWHRVTVAALVAEDIVVATNCNAHISPVPSKRATEALVAPMFSGSGKKNHSKFYFYRIPEKRRKKYTKCVIWMRKKTNFLPNLNQFWLQINTGC